MPTGDVPTIFVVYYKIHTSWRLRITPTTDATKHHMRKKGSTAHIKVVVFVYKIYVYNRATTSKYPILWPIKIIKYRTN